MALRSELFRHYTVNKTSYKCTPGTTGNIQLIYKIAVHAIIHQQIYETGLAANLQLLSEIRITPIPHSW